MACKTLYQKDFPFHLADIYRALDEIAELKDELETFQNRQIAELLPREASCLYLDATNYYFETDFALEDHLPLKGVSKEHRLSPIVQMGLILDSNGLPIFSEAFSGNTSDCKMLIPMLKKAVESGNFSRCIVVADKGLNTSENIDYLVNHGHGYVFSQILRGKKGKRYEDALFSEEGYVVNADGTVPS